MTKEADAPHFLIIANLYFLKPFIMRIQKMPPDAELPTKLKAIVEARDKQCSRCGEECTIRLKDERYYKRCNWVKCRQETSLFKNTPFESGNVDYVTTLKVLHFWFSNVNRTSISELLGVAKSNITRLLYKTCDLLKEKYYNILEKIGRPGVVVEVDESKFGKRKYNRGNRSDQCWVLGMIERTPAKRIIVVVVPDRKSCTLISILKKYMHEESIVYLDCWKGYNAVKNNLIDHYTVNHTVSFVDYITGVHTNTIEGNWTGLKQGVPVQNRTKKKNRLLFIKIYVKKKL